MGNLVVVPAFALSLHSTKLGLKQPHRLLQERMLIVHNQYPQQSELLRIQHRFAEYLALEGRSR